jgi:hypothetical protein
MDIHRLAAGIVLTLGICNTAIAERYWPEQPLTDWQLALDNGVAYISSPQFAGHCSYDRGQINMDGTEFNSALYAYALSASAMGKDLLYVVDRNQTTCVITGLFTVK